MRVRVESIGCRLNIGEMEHLARQLSTAGHRIVGPGDDADVCVFNSCTVTSTAARKSRQLMRQIRRSNPSAALVVTGCYSELEKESAAELGADLIVTNRDKDRIAEILVERRLLPQAVALEDSPPLELSEGLRTRAFLKVQDGCDNSCTFCIVTIARGAGVSRPPERVISEVSSLVEAGYHEVVLSGVHLGSYGHDFGDRRGLFRLVRKILDESSIQRLRLSSLEPWDLHSSFFDLFEDPRLLPHLHLPLQSGCDSTLKRMARRTTCTEFTELVDTARSRVPDLSVSSDIMVGFPGETDEEFEASRTYVEDLQFSKLHIFRYSRRKGTRAANLPNQIPGPVTSERSRRMHELAARMETAFNRQFENREMKVLWETSEPFGDGLRWSGLTPNYIRVVTETNLAEDLLNRVTPTRILSPFPGGLLGHVDGISRQTPVEATAKPVPILSRDAPSTSS